MRSKEQTGPLGGGVAPHGPGDGADGATRHDSASALTTRTLIGMTGTPVVPPGVVPPSARTPILGIEQLERLEEAHTIPLLSPVQGPPLLGERREETRTIPPLSRGQRGAPRSSTSLQDDTRKTLIISATTPTLIEPRWQAEEATVVPVPTPGLGELRPLSSALQPGGDGLEPGVLIDGKYRVVRELGRGGMGIVYLSEDVALRRSVAVKVLLPRYARDPRHAERFRREARMLAAIEDENVVHIHALGDHAGLPYLVMDYVMGETLATFLAGMQVSYEVIPLDLAYSLSRQLCRALSAVHAAGIVHRDVKPGNVMVTAGPRAILMDFSLARDTHASFSGNHIVGTPDYVAPEQIRGRPLLGTEGQRSDIYSLGVTLFETLTGQLPFQGSDSATVLHCHLRQPPPRPSEIRPDLPGAFDPVLLRALAKDPGERWSSCDELGEALAVSYRAARGTPRRRILIVVDEPEHGRALARMVGAWVPGAEVEVVPGGAALQQAGKRQVPSLVLMDLQAGGPPGPEEICAELRGDPVTARIPVVVLAGEDAVQPVDRRFLRLLGVRAVVGKPADPVRLAALLRVVVSGDAASALT